MQPGRELLLNSSVKTTARPIGGFNTANTGSNGAVGPIKTGSNAQATGDGGSVSNLNTDSDTITSGKLPIPLAAIIGISIGAAILVCLIVCGGWRYRRSRLNELSETRNPSNYSGNDFGGKAELASVSVSPLPLKNEAAHILALSSGIPPVTQEKPSEMSVPPTMYRAEAPGTTNSAELYQGYRTDHQTPAWGQQSSARIEMYGQSREPRHEMQGSNLTNGTYYEMPGHRG